MISQDFFRKTMTRLAIKCLKTNIDTTTQAFQNALVEWYKDFKVFSPEDLSDAVRSHSTIYFPDMGKFAESVREIARERRLDDSRRNDSFKEVSRKAQNNQPKGVLRDIARDAFNVLKVGVTFELWKAMANKYRDVVNPDFHPERNPYRTFGEFYDKAARELRN